MYLARACQQFSQNDDAKDQEAGQPNQTHAKVGDPWVGASQARLVEEYILLHYGFSQLLSFMQKLLVLFFSEAELHKGTIYYDYTSHNVNVMQRMSAEPDNVCGFCVCCWCWV